MFGALLSAIQTMTSTVMQVVRTIIPPLQYPAPPPNFVAPPPGVTTGQLVNSTSTIQCMWGSAPIPLVMHEDLHRRDRATALYCGGLDP
jgi:hypothetical protein